MGERRAARYDEDDRPAPRRRSATVGLVVAVTAVLGSAAVYVHWAGVPGEERTAAESSNGSGLLGPAILGSGAQSSSAAATGATPTPTTVSSSALTAPTMPAVERARAVTASRSTSSTSTSTRRTASPTSTASRSSQTPSPSASRPPAPAPRSDAAGEVVRLTNIERSKVGCRPLKVDSALTRAADDHASDMVRRHYFSHTGADGSSFSDRTSRAGYGGFATAENIAAGQPTAEAVVRSWMQSPGHRMNIVNCAYNRIGVGYDAGSVGSGYGGGSWVQDFGIS